MDSQRILHLLSLCIRWTAHDAANPLSAVRSGLEIKGAHDIAERGADQLTAWVRCLQLIGAAALAHAQDISAPEDSFQPLREIARQRDVELSIHLHSLSLAQAGLATALGFAIIGHAVSGSKIMMRGRKEEFHLEITNLPGKMADYIKKMLDQQLKYPDEPSDMPFYIALLIGENLKAEIHAETRNEKFEKFIVSIKCDSP